MRTHLLLLPEGEETNSRDLYDLEADTGNITLGLAATTEARDKDLVVLIDEVQATIILRGETYISNERMSRARLGKPKRTKRIRRPLRVRAIIDDLRARKR